MGPESLLLLPDDGAQLIQLGKRHWISRKQLWKLSSGMCDISYQCHDALPPPQLQLLQVHQSQKWPTASVFVHEQHCQALAGICVEFAWTSRAFFTMAAEF